MQGEGKSPLDCCESQDIHRLSFTEQFGSCLQATREDHRGIVRDVSALFCFWSDYYRSLGGSGFGRSRQIERSAGQPSDASRPCALRH